MDTNTQQWLKRRLDYSAPDFHIDSVELSITLDPTDTLVQSRLEVRRNEYAGTTMQLDGEGLRLQSVCINGVVWHDYECNEQALVLHNLPDDACFELAIECLISPKDNASLEGLYLSNGAYCTQCEAEGFRKITYYLDRPDVLAIFTVHIIADTQALPYLLSNGNMLARETLANGLEKVTWHDPFKKPCYLFALVAGNFDKLQDNFVNASGKNIALELYVDKGRAEQGHHALASLVKSMQWDEQKYGLEYDLDVYMVVAVDFFNMGAMENKGLNVFNSKYVLAAPETATDEDYFNIESIIAHEYFHNWTGNRVTCRDWFQLSLKEGLTVFRDQQFSADMTNSLSTRIAQVKVMREHQFAEDAGPMRHPIRPDEVMEMNNFYTVTVYDKGAEVIRMLHTLLGEQGFRAGMDLYFARHDGQAVTCDDFVQAMQDANQHDLSHFTQWYCQAGTPLINVEKLGASDSASLHFSQSIAQHKPSTGAAPALYIPIKLQYLSRSGEVINSGLVNDTLVLDQASQTINVAHPSEDLVPVLLIDFSAPVKINYPYSDDELLVIVQHASSDYAKWDAAQNLYQEHVKYLYQQLIEQNKAPENEFDELAQSPSFSAFTEALRSLISSGKCAAHLLAEILTLPSVETLMGNLSDVEPNKLCNAWQYYRAQLAENLFAELLSCYQAIPQFAYAYDKHQVNQRKLKTAALLVLAASKAPAVTTLVSSQYEHADNMTDTLSALKAAQIADDSLFSKLMLAFEQRYAGNAVVMDKWFTLHASAQRPDILGHLSLLACHAQFTINNPNKVRSLIGTFAFYNVAGFHAKDGSGYKFVTDYLMKLDSINPQVAARIVTPLIQWQHLNVHYQGLIKAQLSRLLNHPRLSKDVFEKVSKSLAQDEL